MHATASARRSCHVDQAVSCFCTAEIRNQSAGTNQKRAPTEHLRTQLVRQEAITQMHSELMTGALDVALTLVAQSMNRMGYSLPTATTAPPTPAEAPPNPLGALHTQVVDEPTQGFD